jgi:small nuclear ribonucleoprotein (snRNP)-like protein
MNLILTNSRDITEKDTKILDKILLRSDNILAVLLPDKFNSFERKENA